MNSVQRLHARGILRRGTKEGGFRYRAADGRPATPEARERIAVLRIPPAWKDVAIAASAAGRIQAVGRDAAGRWQYIYDARYRMSRERAKHKRVVQFAAALPQMRRAVGRDLRRSGLPREKVLACMLRVIASCYIRGGSQKHTDANGSYGIATLRVRHAAVSGSVVRFDFPGKGGKRQTLELRDRTVSRIVAELSAAPGRDLFKFQGPDGTWVDVRRRHVNAYIKEVMGADFSAKDFRTWAGTLLCACALARAGAAARRTAASRRRTIAAAVRETADALGNTPAICRASYISPTVLTRFEHGRVVEKWISGPEELAAHRQPALHCSERALLNLLG